MKRVVSDDALRDCYRRMVNERAAELEDAGNQAGAEQVRSELSGASREERLSRVLAWSEIPEFTLDGGDE